MFHLLPPTLPPLPLGSSTSPLLPIFLPFFFLRWWDHHVVINWMWRGVFGQQRRMQRYLPMYQNMGRETGQQFPKKQVWIGCIILIQVGLNFQSSAILILTLIWFFFVSFFFFPLVSYEYWYLNTWGCYTGLRRCGKSCRLRWTNYLRPDLKHESFTPQEEELIVRLHATIGSRLVGYWFVNFYMSFFRRAKLHIFLFPMTQTSDFLLISLISFFLWHINLFVLDGLFLNFPLGTSVVLFAKAICSKVTRKLERKDSKFFLLQLDLFVTICLVTPNLG